MFCNGNCGLCQNKCFRGEVRHVVTESINVSKAEEKGASDAFDMPVNIQSEETGLALVDSVEHYEVVRNVFGKEKVRKVK